MTPFTKETLISPHIEDCKRFQQLRQQLRCHEVRTERATGIYPTAYSGKTAVFRAERRRVMRMAATCRRLPPHRFCPVTAIRSGAPPADPPVSRPALPERLPPPPLPVSCFGLLPPQPESRRDPSGRG